MKTFHYADGRVAKTTMTVAELRAELSKYPDDMPVFAEWETVYGDVRADNFTVTAPTGTWFGEVPSLLINVDEY